MPRRPQYIREHLRDVILAHGKRCTGPCRQVKAVSEFYLHVGGGWYGECKECFGARVRAKLPPKKPRRLTKREDARLSAAIWSLQD